MPNVVGVRFKRAGKVYYFDPLEIDLQKGDHVIVETARGLEYGEVVTPIREVSPEDEMCIRDRPVIDIIKEICHSREQLITPMAPVGSNSVESYMPYPIEVLVGGATVFVLDVEKFVRV